MTQKERERMEQLESTIEDRDLRTLGLANIVNAQRKAGAVIPKDIYLKPLSLDDAIACGLIERSGMEQSGSSVGS